MVEPARETVRIHQANERTLLAWIRTSIAIMAFGFALARFVFFLRQWAAVDPAARPVRGLGSGWVGAALVFLGTLTSLLATLSFTRVRADIERGQLGAPSPALPVALGAAATLVGMAMGFLLLQSLAESAGKP
jgi:putative membrane protein